MAVLTSEPIASISGQISVWSAAFNNIVFTMQNDVDYKNNLRIEVKIISSGKEVIGVYSPGSDGKFIVNIYKLIKSFIRPVDKFEHTTTNFIDRNLFAKYSFSWREVWENESLVTLNDDWRTPKDFYITYSAMQLGESYGGNMAEYLTFPGSSAKFLTEFKQPKMWEGLPYDISFILSEKLVFKQVFFKFTTLDINGNEVIDGINLYYLLTEEGGKFINEASVGGLLLENSDLPPLLEDIVGPENTLPKDVGIVRLRVPNVAPNVYQVKLEVFYIQGEEIIKITEDKLINIIRPCTNDPFVYLKWMNHLGAWDYYRFGYNQSINNDVSNEQTISRPVTNWLNQEAITEVIKKSAVGKITLGAEGVSSDDLKALDWLRQGIKAQMLISSNPVKWQTVIVQPSNNERETRKSTGSFKITIQLPETNIQNQ